MGSAQDRILEYAKGMGEFSTSDMARMIYGERYRIYDLQNTYAKLAKLVTWGQLVKVDKRRINNQFQVIWRGA